MTDDIIYDIFIPFHGDYVSITNKKGIFYIEKKYRYETTKQIEELELAYNAFDIVLAKIKDKVEIERILNEIHNLVIRADKRVEIGLPVSRHYFFFSDEKKKLVDEFIDKYIIPKLIS